LDYAEDNKNKSGKVRSDMELVTLPSVDAYKWLRVGQGSIIAWGKGKGKAIPLQSLAGPEVSRRLRLPDFRTIGI
jgi:hypothetical protein